MAGRVPEEVPPWLEKFASQRRQAQLPKTQAKVLAEENGAKILGSVSKKLDYLVIGNSKPTKKKIDKAKELKIDLITEEKWYGLLNR